MKLVDIDTLNNESICEHCKYKSTRCEYTCDEDGNEIETLWEMIDNLPEVDAEPVRHGHWITHNEGNPFEIYGKCSICGFSQSISDHLNYCPDCGAKMDEVEDGTD